MSISMKNPGQVESNAVSPHSVATAVRDARVAVGYSIDDLAVTTGLVAAEIAEIEDGTSADPAKLKRIAAALQLPASDFLVL